MAANMRPHPLSGLVPMRVNVSEAGFGLIAGEIRGLDPAVAERMSKMETVDPATGKSVPNAVFDDECEAGVAAAEAVLKPKGKPVPNPLG